MDIPSKFHITEWKTKPTIIGDYGSQSSLKEKQIENRFIKSSVSQDETFGSTNSLSDEVKNRMTSLMNDDNNRMTSLLNNENSSKTLPLPQSKQRQSLFQWLAGSTLNRERSSSLTESEASLIAKSNNPKPPLKIEKLTIETNEENPKARKRSLSFSTFSDFSD